MIHISARLVRQEIGSFEWWIGNIVDSSTRWAVPVFIMLSGMLLLGKQESQLDVLRKRVGKLLWPLLFWSFIYSLWKVRHDIETYSFRQFMIEVFQDSIKYHFWYLYVILGLYLCMPLFKMFIQNGRKEDIRYFLFLSFFISASTLTISSFFEINLAGGFEYLLGYGGYFLLGYYLANTTLARKKTSLIHILGAAALLITIVGTWLLSTRIGTLSQVFYEYLSFTTPFVAISIFLLVKDWGNKETSKATVLIANYSFGIYLIHPLILDIYRSKEFIQLTGISHTTTHPVLYVLIIFTIAFSTSLFLSYILCKFPATKKLV
ncbi:acyltransferase [Mesobacillus foraminis]|uniref:acyltransferase n=1 Tax=Mesobacillus foraminis TaxID=279826 RepID=UPI0013CF0FC1|nr:acyltransferase family protein [Mesobacillus foraminis]